MNKLLKLMVTVTVLATAITANAKLNPPSEPVLQMNRCAAVYMIANNQFNGDINATRWATKHNFLYQRARRISMNNNSDPADAYNQAYLPIANYYLSLSQVSRSQLQREVVADLAKCDKYYVGVDGAVAAENAGIGQGNTIQY